MRWRRTKLWALAAMLVVSSPAWGQQKIGKVDKEGIAKAAEQTQKRLKSLAAEWEMDLLMPNGVKFAAKVVHAADKRKVSLRYDMAEIRGELFWLIERDGAWYVSESGSFGKYRPFEVPLNAQIEYLCLAVSRPFLVTDVLGWPDAALEGMDGGVAGFRVPVSAGVQAQLRGVLAQLGELMKRDPAVLKDEAMRSKLAEVRDKLERGVPLRVEAATGMVVEYERANLSVTVRNFRWLDAAPAKEFDTAGREWKDFTSDPTKGVDPNDLAMIAHCGGWRPGMKDYSLDGRIINVRTGEFRRIPFAGPVVLPGCFTSDRTAVVVTGADIHTGAIGIYEVNLSTGRNRRLGGALLEGGTALMPALSPDGKALAVLHRGGTEYPLDVQVCLVDLPTGETRKLGKPLDTAFLNWLPDSSGLILLARERGEWNKPPPCNIARMNLNGEVKVLRKGDHPVIPPGGKTILFRDEDLLWKTCDLAGQNVAPFAGGMKNHSFPSPGPDGRRILWMRYGSADGPEPVVVEIGAQTDEPITKVKGLWTMPAWR